MPSNDNNHPVPVAIDRPEESVTYVVTGRQIRRVRDDGRAELLAGAEREAAARWIVRATGGQVRAAA